jgi:hypothetical protein
VLVLTIDFDSLQALKAIYLFYKFPSSNFVVDSPAASYLAFLRFVSAFRPLCCDQLLFRIRDRPGQVFDTAKYQLVFFELDHVHAFFPSLSLIVTLSPKIDTAGLILLY